MWKSQGDDRAIDTQKQQGERYYRMQITHSEKEKGKDVIINETRSIVEHCGGDVKTGQDLLYSCFGFYGALRYYTATQTFLLRPTTSFVP